MYSKRHCLIFQENVFALKCRVCRWRVSLHINHLFFMPKPFNRFSRTEDKKYSVLKMNILYVMIFSIQWQIWVFSMSIYKGIAVQNGVKQKCLLLLSSPLWLSWFPFEYELHGQAQCFMSFLRIPFFGGEGVMKFFLRGGRVHAVKCGLAHTFPKRFPKRTSAQLLFWKSFEIFGKSVDMNWLEMKIFEKFSGAKKSFKMYS